MPSSRRSGGSRLLLATMVASIGCTEPGAPPAIVVDAATVAAPLEAPAARPSANEAPVAVAPDLPTESATPAASTSHFPRSPPPEPYVAAPDPPHLLPDFDSEIVDFAPREPPGGVPGGVIGNAGRATPTPAPLPPGSRRAPASMLGRLSECPFPPEADAEGIDSATVHAVARVDAAGKAKNVMITKDPGAGFGRAARTCLLAQKYKPGLDDAGNVTETATSTIVVRFVR